MENLSVLGWFLGIALFSSCGGAGAGPILQPGTPVTYIEGIEERTTIVADGMYNGPANSVAVLSNGSWLLAYSRGTSHIGAVDNVTRISTDEGATWSPEALEPLIPGAPAYGVVHGKYLRNTPMGFLSSVADDPTVPVYNRSTDDGAHWSAYTSFDFPRNAGVSMLAFFDGTDMYTNAYYGEPNIGTGNSSFLLKSSDDGVTWTTVSAIRAAGDAAVNETGVAKVGPTRIVAISRSDSETATYVKFSDDMGATWGPQLDYTSQVGVLQLPQVLNMGKFLLLVGRDGRNNRLVAFLSQDNGHTFGGKTVLDTYTGSYVDGGYSWLLPMTDGRVFVSYYADTNNMQKPDIKSLKLRFATHLMASAVRAQTPMGHLQYPIVGRRAHIVRPTVVKW